MTLLPAVLGLLLGTADAQINPCPFAFVPCAAGGAEGFNEFLQEVVFKAMRLVFIAGALANFFFYAFRLLIQASDEEATKTAKSGYEQAIYGCAYMSLASFFVEAFGESARNTIVNPEPLESAFSNVALYIKLLTGALVTVVIVVVAFRLVLVQDDGERDKAKKRLLSAFIAVVILTLANTVVAAFVPGVGLGVLTPEIVGMANYLLTIFGALAVLWFVGAGIVLVISVNEDQKETAKKALFTAVIAISVVVSSYILINFFLSL